LNCSAEAKRAVRSRREIVSTQHQLADQSQETLNELRGPDQAVICRHAGGGRHFRQGDLALRNAVANRVILTLRFGSDTECNFCCCNACAHRSIVDQAGAR
jgi:hypothetical protein